MGEKVKLKGGIYEVEFGYHPKMGGYTTLMSDILKLYAMLCLTNNGVYEKLSGSGGCPTIIPQQIIIHAHI